MDNLYLPSILQILSQAGLALVIFVIWYITFVQIKRDMHTTIEKYEEMNKELIQLLKEEQEYKSMLAGIMMRLEEKLSKPVVCPIVKGDKHAKE